MAMSDSRIRSQVHTDERFLNSEISVFDSEVESQQVELIYRQAPAAISQSGTTSREPAWAALRRKRRR